MSQPSTSPAERAIRRTALQWKLSLPQLPLDPKKQVIETSWSVVTGVFSSGLSTITADLEKIGFSIGAETARPVILRARAWRSQTGRQLTLKEVLGSQELQQTIYSEELSRLRSLSPEQPILLDRSLPDVLAFSRLGKHSAEFCEMACHHFRFRRIFILEPLPYVQDEARDWTPEQRGDLHRLLTESYRSLGYAPISVPVLGPAERRNFVASFLRED